MSNFPKSIERITIVEAGPGNETLATVAYRAKRKRSTGPLRRIEEFVRHAADAQRTVINEYMDLHNQSNREEKDGWLRDMGNNVYKAFSRGARRMKREME